ncbi:hypothetical protein AOLI_G00053920 [Acnodon oligacanthus]
MPHLRCFYRAAGSSLLGVQLQLEKRRDSLSRMLPDLMNSGKAGKAVLCEVPTLLRECLLVGKLQRRRLLWRSGGGVSVAVSCSIGGTGAAVLEQREREHINTGLTEPTLLLINIPGSLLRPGFVCWAGAGPPGPRGPPG